MSHSFKIPKITHLPSFIPGYGNGDYVTLKVSPKGKVIYRIVGLVPPKGAPGVYAGVADPESDLVMELQIVVDKRTYGDVLTTDEYHNLIHNAGFWDNRDMFDGDFISLKGLLKDYRPCTEAEILLYVNA